MGQKAVFPGSFDPFTVGHEDIVKRGLELFDEIIIAVGENSQKKYYLDYDKRVNGIKQVFNHEPKLRVEKYQGLNVNFCDTIGANYILRGLRSPGDFEYERPIAQLNRSLPPSIETIFLISQPALAHISSSIVREILIHGGDVSEFLPEKIKELL